MLSKQQEFRAHPLFQIIVMVTLVKGETIGSVIFDALSISGEEWAYVTA